MTYFHFVEVCVKGTNPGVSTFLDGFSGEICCYVSWENGHEKEYHRVSH